MATHNDTGKTGELKAIEYLKLNDYSILETNWRYKKAEIDIIAEKNKQIICIEVKTRTRLDFGNPESFVSKQKINLLLQAINNYVEINNINNEIRFDIISVYINKQSTKIDHIENAFYHF